MNIEVSIIIPCYAVGATLVADIMPKIEVLDTLGCSYELLIVLDGPDNDAEAQALQLEKTHPQVKLLKLKQNKGKGYAVRYGMSKAVGKYIGFMDVDNDINPQILAEMYKVIVKGDCDAVLPSKRHPESNVKYPGNRKLFSNLYNLYVRRFLGWPVSDTQLGAKLYRAELIKDIIQHCRINGFIFELEMLAHARAHGYTRFREIPVSLELTTRSTIRFSGTLKIIAETLKFSWDYKTGNIFNNQNANQETYSEDL
jgi:glycosyltransferase involved in cell wall biosynthesis